MNVVCDFSVGFDNEIEDISLYSPLDSEKSLEKFLNRIIEEKKLRVGERCEGSIFVKDTERFDEIKIEYRWCSDVGEDWNDDVWNDKILILNRDDYDI